MCCGRNNRRSARQSMPSGGSCCCCTSVTDCGCQEATAPSATISMADYESFILVPTSVFDQGDVDCGCSEAW